MKLSRFISFALILTSGFAVLALMTSLVQAAPNSGTITVCDDVHLSAALTGGGLVTFNCGGPATLTVTSTKTIAANTTIDGGDNITLTSNGVQLFVINSGMGLTLTNMTIANLNGASFAFPIVNNGRLMLSATNVISNNYLINNTAASATAAVANSTFVTNTGVMLNASGAFTVTNSQFLRNAPGGSGLFVIFNNVTGTIDNSAFISNVLTSGDLLYSNGGLFAVTHSRFQQNTGSLAIIAAFGPLSLDNSDFISNTTTGVYATRPVIASNSHFYWNRSSGDASLFNLNGYGWSPALTLTNSSVMSNTASGGAIYDYYGGPLFISNTQFVSNTSTSSRGAIYLDYPGLVQIYSSTFQINSGGSIYANGQSTPLIITDSQFISNTSTGSSAGLSVWAATITHSRFIGNQANTIGNPYAGALNASGPVYITGSTFLNNIGSYGGAMSLSWGGGPINYDTIVNSVIKGNVSTANNGGGIRATQYLDLQNSEISDNIAQGDANGGGLYFAGYVLTATRTLFQNNTVTGTNGTGGGLYVSGSASSIADSTIISNSATGSGGGIYLNYFSNDGPALITHTTVQSNTASAAASSASGGGIYATAGWGSINLSLFDVALSNNRTLGNANGSGGGLYFYGGNDAGVLTISRSLIDSNALASAASQGGGLYLNGGAIITNSTLYSNSAGSGGALYFLGSYSLTLVNNTIMSNTYTTGVITNQLNNTGAANRVVLANTIIGGSNGGNCAGNKVLSLGHNLSSDVSCALTGTLDLSNTNPLLGAFQNNGGATYSFMPTTNSPAVNAGDSSQCPIDDQRGVARPIGSACDIGSIESPYLTPQTITFSALPDRFVNHPPFIITATASSNLVVAFNSSGVCGVAGNTVTLSGIAGTCTITATQPGDSNYAPAADVARTFTVTLVPQTISFAPLPDRVVSDPPFTLTATASSNLLVAFNAGGVCAVNGITVTLSGVAGSCTITATQIGNATYAPADAVGHSFNVIALLTQTIDFAPLPDRFINESPFSIAPTASSGLSVTVTSLTTGICVVTDTLVTQLATGLCTLRASQPGNTVYAPTPNVDRSYTVKPLYKTYLPLIIK
jgi:hypothetical protein